MNKVNVHVLSIIKIGLGYPCIRNNIMHTLSGVGQGVVL